MNAVVLQIAPTDVPGFAVRILVVLGGALVGGLLVGFLARVLLKLLTTRSMPLWMVRFLRLVGGVAGGWLVFLFVWSGGGGGSSRGSYSSGSRRLTSRLLLRGSRQRGQGTFHIQRSRV